MKKENKKSEWLYRWIRLSQEGVTIDYLCRERGWDRIALYGLNDISRLFVYDTMDTGINVLFIIDQDSGFIKCDFPLKSIKEASLFTGLDAIIVCIISDFDSVCSELKSKFYCDVISFEDFLYEV